LPTTFVLKPRTLLFSVLSVLVVAGIVLAVRDALDASAILSAFSFRLFLWGVLSHFFALVLNAVRLDYSLRANSSAPRRTRAGLGRALDLMVLHNFLISYLPARIADGYYPLLVARRTGVSVGVGVGNLILLRMFDVLAIAAILAALAPLVYGTSELSQLYVVIAPLAGALVIVSVKLSAALSLPLHLLARPARRFHWISHVYRFLNQARHWVRSFSAAQRLSLIVLSLGPWVASSVTYLIAIDAVGLDLQWSQAMLAGKLAELGAAVPIQAAGGIGVGEGIMASVLAGFGVPLGLAVVGTIAVRVVILAIVAVIFSVRSLFVLGYAIRRPTGRSVMSSLFGPENAIE